MTFIRPATPQDFQAFAPEIHEAHAMIVECQPVALCLLSRMDDGRLWLALDVKPGAAGHGVRMVRFCRELLGRVGQDVYAPCQEVSFPQAPPLLAAIGFERTDEVYKNIMPVWVWRR